MPEIYAPFENLRAFAEWAEANGYHVGENRLLGKRTYSPVHAPAGYHPVNQAVDINKNGPNEKRDLARALTVADAFGLGTIHALHGTAGIASSHRTHLHVDMGPRSHWGVRWVRRGRSTSLTTWRIQKALHVPAKDRDNLWGPDTRKRVNAVIAASGYGGQRFPHGVKYTQGLIGTKQDGSWGPASIRAHDAAVAAMNRAMGRPATKIVTESFVRAIRAAEVKANR